MDPKKGDAVYSQDIVGKPTFRDPDTGCVEYGDPKGWRTKFDRNAPNPYGTKGWWRWTFMGNQQTPQQAMTPTVPTPIDPTLMLDKGDYCQLKASKRKFRIIDERKDENGNFEELCKFEDDNRNPVWLPHTWLVGEVNILEKA